MPFFDSIIKKCFPKTIRNQIADSAEQISGAAVARIKAQAGFGQTVIHYAGADRSAGAKYPQGLSGTGNIHLDHYRLRQQARDAYHDTPQAKALVERHADTVADIGLMLEPAPKAQILGLPQEEVDAWSRRIEERFDAWARSKAQHRAETMTWYQSHRLYGIFQQRDNDVFVRLYYCRDRGLQNPVQFEFIDPNQVRGDACTYTYATNGGQEDGITRDKRGRETGYKVFVQKKLGEYHEVIVPRYGRSSGRIMMLHGFAPEYAGQGRGYSRLGFALQEFENLTDFSLSKIKQAINQSQVALYVKPSQDKDASNPLSGILNAAGAGPAVRTFGADPAPDPDAQNVTAESTASVVSYQNIPEATVTAPGSTNIFNLEAGEDLKTLEVKSAAESYNSFVEAFTSYLSAAMSMPVEVLLMKFNANYSASRASLILFWRVACIWREEMAADYLNPTYEMWLAEEIAAGREACPGWSDPRLRAAWLNCRWVGSPMPNIDPARTMTADKGYVEMGAQTLDRVARNLNGSSGTANRAKLRREVDELAKVPWAKGVKK
ncbi:MAG: phage portal protein [Desulfobacteraceae bacterium]|nr:phage portal protein [Desulfobacteraceae bacterium]